MDPGFRRDDEPGVRAGGDRRIDIRAEPGLCAGRSHNWERIEAEVASTGFARLALARR
jgi:hypothetical protein